MTDLEDAREREHTAAIMHWQLCNARDRGEPVDWLLADSHAEWVSAKEYLESIPKEKTA